MTDWAAGDLALCKFSGPWMIADKGSDHGQPSSGPALGSIHAVKRVATIPLHKHGPQLFLAFAEWDGWYHAKQFVKVTPPEADDGYWYREGILDRQPQPKPVKFEPDREPV